MELPLGLEQDASNLGEHLKIAFGSSWEDELCGDQFDEGNVEPGSPAVLIFSGAALRSLDLLRFVFLFFIIFSFIMLLVDA